MIRNTALLNCVRQVALVTSRARCASTAAYPQVRNHDYREVPNAGHDSTSNGITGISESEPRCLQDVSAHTKDNLLDKDPYKVKIVWKHPTYDKDEMRKVDLAHLEPQCWQDRAAWNVLAVVRKSFDLATGYKHPPKGEEANPKYMMTPTEWLRRVIFLESIAGVPGMVGGMVRHLHSLRVMNRDKAWIESLIEESYNERMHLLSFIKIAKSGRLMRLMLLGAQGVFFNMFFVAYILFPRICHRFVGYLEEEAIVTYTRLIEDMEQGRLPEFSEMKAPDIATNYWHMPADASVRDMIYYVRADESKHREVNHTLGNLNQKTDPNPYSLDYSRLAPEEPRPTADLKYSNSHPVGWKREDIKF